ncbi:hypothetical protein OG203_03515 [Nocardia sp. NBC_01499]|uniref:hypothetical protein n=1 Tax=Nocardia sp. NBC_01499 TaxID=2903597 RepID=UPI00386669FC
MDSGKDDNATVPSRAVTGWTVGLICVAIFAGGVIVSALLHDREPESTTATSTAPGRSYVTPPVAFPVQIPGCTVVEPPAKGGLTSRMTTTDLSYDNPAYPWFSGPKAVAMSQALRDALPQDAEIAFAPVDRSLLFQPILAFPGESADQPGPDGWTRASGTLLRGGSAGKLSVSVRQSAVPVPPCVAGDLIERRHLADGTTVDVQDTWYEIGGVRTLSRAARAYLLDGSAVTAAATDGTDAADHSGTVPMTLDDLAAVATAPGLRVTAPVPPGTLDVPESCGNVFEKTGTVDEGVARRLDAVLARIPLKGLSLDRPLGQLRPPESAASGVCQVVRVTTPGRQSRLSVAITVGQHLPDASATSAGYGESVTSRQLPDGTVVENRESRYSAGSGAQAIPKTQRTVTVTRRSGTRVEVASTADDPTEPLSIEQLEEIAMTPDLEVR